MEDKIIQYIEKLEFSEFEAKIYITALAVGAKTIRELAQILGINRTTAYLHIERLVEKGLLMKITEGAKTLIVPNEPREILSILVDKKVASAKTIQEDFATIADALTKRYLPFKDTDDTAV